MNRTGVFSISSDYLSRLSTVKKYVPMLPLRFIYGFATISYEQLRLCMVWPGYLCFHDDPDRGVLRLCYD